MAQNFFNDLADRLTGFKKDRIAVVDTDSCVMNLTDIVDKIKPKMPEGGTTEEIVKFLDKLGATKFQEAIDTGFEDLQKRQNAYKHYLTMKREKIGHLITCAKKRYISKVYVNEDVWYTEPDISITGLESARSDVPKFCRDRLEEVYGKLFDLNETTVQDFIAEIKREFMKLPVTQISVPKGLSDLTKYELPNGLYGKGTPQHAKAAIVYNRVIRQRGLLDRYNLIRSGDKLRVLPLKQPNPFREETIGFLDTLPKEFEVDKYVDRDAIFLKTLEAPLNRVMEVMGWTVKKRYSLDDFF